MANMVKSAERQEEQETFQDVAHLFDDPDSPEAWARYNRYHLLLKLVRLYVMDGRLAGENERSRNVKTLQKINSVKALMENYPTDKALEGFVMSLQGQEEQYWKRDLLKQLDN